MKKQQTGIRAKKPIKNDFRVVGLSFLLFWKLGVGLLKSLLYLTNTLRVSLSILYIVSLTETPRLSISYYLFIIYYYSNLSYYVTILSIIPKSINLSNPKQISLILCLLSIYYNNYYQKESNIKILLNASKIAKLINLCFGQIFKLLASTN